MYRTPETVRISARNRASAKCCSGTGLYRFRRDGPQMSELQVDSSTSYHQLPNIIRGSADYGSNGVYSTERWEMLRIR